MELPLDHVSSKEFDEPDAASILGPMPESASVARKPRLPADLPPYLASLYEVPLLSGEQELYLFRKYNFLKYRASRLRAELNPARPKSRLLDEIEQLHAQAVETKNQIVRANLRLVVSIAKKYTAEHDTLFDLISDGNMSLFRAVERFDYTLGFKFSTYASWSIKKNYAREYTARARYSDRFRTSLDEPLQGTPDSRSDAHQQERLQERRELQVDKVLGCLDEREREIIKRRFGLHDREQAQTLQEVGDDLGVSKERIRQIEARALAKLRGAAAAELSDVI
ncbi:MAG: sigma-70 family RNA polymerase sigma factor [Planctomycetes bacterium]|nr:sigma-70 family RNA polymerase sigma factor [Planctomycetota bacterium]